MGAFVSSCSDISENERLVVINVVEHDTTTVDTTTVDTTNIDFFAPQQRCVLIEDFTGQNCVNCPNATDIISQLQNRMYDHKLVVAVAIHSGPLGIKPERHPQGLATDLGDIYYNYWKIEMQPYGVIDRSDGPLAIDWWMAKVNYDLYEDNEGGDANAEPRMAPINIWAKTSSGNDNATDIEVKVAGVSGTTTGKLQLFLTEDSIQAFQKMPDGKVNYEYIHNHVLRDAINGTWGEDVTVAKDEMKTFNYHYTPQVAWKPEHLTVVAFVYNDDGVLQVTNLPLVQK
jgi:hypothetical protein